MIFAHIGKVIDIQDREFKCRDITTDEVFSLHWTGKESIADLQDQTCIIYGEVKRGKFNAIRLDMNRFLTPLYENHLVTNVISALKDLEDNPFDDLYEKYSRL